MAGSFDAWAGSGTGIDDRDSRRHCRGDRGEPLTVQPPAGDLAGRPGCYARHWAAGGLFVALGQRRGAVPALDTDALTGVWLPCPLLAA